MRVFFVGQNQLRIGTGIVLLIMVVTGFWLNSDQVVRRLFGVKRGVSLAGVPVAGLLPEEVNRVVMGLAEKINREPRDAGYFPETGELIPAQTGKKVCITATIRRICRAKAGEKLRMVTTEVSPRISDQYFQPVYQGNPTKARVALAINVAWGEEYLPELLRILTAAQVKATFFMVGGWAKAFPELTRALAEAGHEIANHGLYHGHPLQMDRVELRRLITANEALLAEIIQHQPAKLFAPPYGEINPKIVAVAGELGYRTVMWSVDTIDWKRPTPQALLARVLDRIRPGGIILMHPTISSRDALKQLLQSLKERGLQPGTVTEVLE
jgi:probable sporulation protein (polysaccharide deacetylase family)